MVLGPLLLLRLVQEVNLVEGLSTRELTNPEGAGFDLRLGEISTLVGEGYLGIEDRKTPDAVSVAKYNPNTVTKFVFEPGKQYVVSTVESVNLPLDITANLWMRSTLYRSGMILSGGNVAPGYSGRLSFTFFNSGECPVTVELGSRVVHILFFEVKSGGNSYRGQWQGGRVSAKTREKQV